MNQRRAYQICSRCVMDTTVPEIHFDDHGACQFCEMHDILDARYPLGDEGERLLSMLVEQIRHAGAGRDYDCVVGTSGGRDSTWTMYTAKKLGLRPLAVHFDNGWNSETAVTNIRNATDALAIDLETYVADWEEFKDIQIAFLRASVPDVEVPTDLAIHSVLHYMAAKEGIKYILNGHSFRTEGVAPRGWTYFDGRYIHAIQAQFGTRRPRDFKNFGIKELLYYSFWKGIKVVPILNFRPYHQQEITDLLTREVGWTYYGGHHHESYYTKFIQSYLLPKKFNIDKRRTELSALIRSGQTTRDEALEYLNTHAYEFDKSLEEYAINKLGLTWAEWEKIYNTPPKSYLDYPSYYPLMRACRSLICWLSDREILPKLLYLKYLG